MSDDDTNMKGVSVQRRVTVFSGSTYWCWDCDTSMESAFRPAFCPACNSFDIRDRDKTNVERMAEAGRE